MTRTTKQPPVARKPKSTKVGTTAAAKSAPGSTVSRKARVTKTNPANRAGANAAAHILRAAEGPRTVSHRKIKEAVDKVFRERANAGG